MTTPLDLADIGRWVSRPGATPAPTPVPEQPKPTADVPFPSRPLGPRQQPATDELIPVTPETVGLGDDLVAHALHALSLFGTNTLREARILLDLWARRDQLTDEQVDEVLAYYRPRIKAVA